MIRNALVLKCIGIHPKTVIHIGAGKGEDRDLYYQIGCEKLIWIEASLEKFLALQSRFPADVALNVYVTKDGKKLNKEADSKLEEKNPR